jgi:hypothetical protein
MSQSRREGSAGKVLRKGGSVLPLLQESLGINRNATYGKACCILMAERNKSKISCECLFSHGPSSDFRELHTVPVSMEQSI